MAASFLWGGQVVLQRRGTAQSQARLGHRTIKSVGRACSIIHALTKRHQGLSLGELAKDLQVHRSTALRLLAQLVDAGIAEHDKAAGVYYLGLEAIAMAGSVLGRFEMLRVAEPHLRHLSEVTRQTINYAVRHRNEMLVIEHIPPPNVFRNFDWLGYRSPLHKGAAGKALLAHLDDAAIASYLEAINASAPTIDATAFWREVLDIRERGFVVNRGEIDADVFSVGAPILNGSGACCASLVIAGYRNDLTADRIIEYSRLVMDAANAISDALGFERRRVVWMA